MDLWELEAAAGADAAAATHAELAGWEFVAQATFCVTEARLKILHRHDDDG
jgi:hypothetical protein